MILGQVTRADGSDAGNFTVTLSGSATRTTTTNANGWYTFGNLIAGGSYTVTASRSNYVVSPGSQSINSLAGEKYANFSASLVIDLSLASTVAPEPAFTGFYLTYTISVTNNGPEPTAATLTSVLSANGVFQNNRGSLDDLGCSRPDGDNHLACGGFPIGPGQTETFQLIVMPTASGTLTNTVNVTGPFFDPNLSNNTVTKTISIQPMPVPTGSTCVAPPSGAVAWYPGDGNANDITAGHSGAMQNGATFAPGIAGQAFSLNGVSSFVQVPDSTAWSFGSAPFTIALWAKFNDPNGEGTFIASDDGGGSQNKWFFLHSGGNLYFHLNSPEYGPVDAVTFPWSAQPGQWYHLAVTRNNSTYTLYIDGLQGNSANEDHVIADSSAALTIGQGFNGLLDEIGIYNRALSTAEIQSIFNAGSYGQCKTASFTGSGQNVIVQTTGADLTFSQVTTTGTSSVVPIDPATVGQVPGGFAVSNSVAYEISTTASFSGPVTLAFRVPGPISQTDFNNLAILHNVNGTLMDVTTTTPARDYSTLTIYATTNSFSPFYLARRGLHINTLFDQTKAYKSGSTVPIKLQALDANNSNVSSSSTSLVARDLRLVSGNTTAPVVDSGNANPDSTFRYDSTLGGSGGGYIFNLSTRGLASGQYVLSFYVGNDRSFFYTVKFEVK
jgi:septal ring-binding cell division protein DamX